MSEIQLTSKQREAVEHGEGPLLIVAGAGTGKTMVIIHRIAHLINSKMARPEEILAVTFTEKAAAEVAGRVDGLLPYGFSNVQISTFHAFGDQVSLVLKLFRERPTILRQIRKRYRFILVDEFQDTNYTQSHFIRVLGGEEANITVVGDDDQSIYKFRGAAISNILSFMEIYPNAKQVVLTENFRSTQVILDTAYRLISLAASALMGKYVQVI